MLDCYGPATCAHTEHRSGDLQRSAVLTCAHLPLRQAIDELNIKPKFWKDLLTDEPFTRKDIIHLQDPLNLQVRPCRRWGVCGELGFR